jgi:hypothetical protein
MRMKYLRKFNESIFDGDWFDYKKITPTDFGVLYFDESKTFKKPMYIEKVKELIQSKVDEEVEVIIIGSGTKQCSSYGWDNEKNMLNIYYLEDDDWIIVKYVTEHIAFDDEFETAYYQTTYYLCEDFVGLKKLITDEIFKEI